MTESLFLTSSYLVFKYYYFGPTNVFVAFSGSLKYILYTANYLQFSHTLSMAFDLGKYVRIYNMNNDNGNNKNYPDDEMDPLLKFHTEYMYYDIDGYIC